MTYMTPLIQFYLTQLKTPKNEVAYYIGIQVAVNKQGPGQMPSNPGKFLFFFFGRNTQLGAYIQFHLTPFIVLIV
jgi:hypothetical protein